MRRGIDSLSAVVATELGQDPTAGDCFVFIGRNRTRLKALVYDAGGYWLCLKRLDRGTFADLTRDLPAGEVSLAITPARLYGLLEGLEIRIVGRRRRENLLAQSI